MTLVLFLAIIFVALLIIFTFFNFFSFFQGAPFVPTTRTNLHIMLDLANLKPNERVAEIGSGDGRIVIELAKRGARVDGYEINPILVLYSIILIYKHHLQKKAHIHWKSFWNTDFSSFTLVTVYCLNTRMGKLEKKLLKELPKGARVISNTFSFPDLKPEKTKGKVKLYKII
jgi:16S rRNA A1518/A1519 N6-dimethyltransferase RsmA/KsgA/DIM1 with predicted DNA glycosylase/AP lyase activity